MADSPAVEIKLSLSSNIYRRSAPTTEHPSIIATTTLLTSSTFTLGLRGELDRNTVLEADFPADLFDFYDLTTFLPVIQSPFPGTCDPGDELFRDRVIQLDSSDKVVRRRLLEDVSPLADPVKNLEVDHEYRLTLKPQKIWCYHGTVADLFGEHEFLLVDDLPEGTMITLASGDELVLKVVA